MSWFVRYPPVSSRVPCQLPTALTCCCSSPRSWGFRVALNPKPTPPPFTNPDADVGVGQAKDVAYIGGTEH